MVAAEDITENCSFSENILETNTTDSQSLRSDTSNESRNSNNNAKDEEPPKESVKPASSSSWWRKTGDSANVPAETDAKKEGVKRKITLAVLLVANLLNYMDRYTLAGVLNDVQDYFSINNSQAGLLQTSFIISYMLLSPIFGYLGDRYNRKRAMIFGIILWSLVTLMGSFVPADSFYLFLMLRAAVGIGEASYSTIAPTIIADLFVGKQRTMALSIFYFAIPVGSGLGYIVGAQVASLAGAWYWSLRVTPVLGLVCAVTVFFLVVEPKRGASDGGDQLITTSFKVDVKYLLTHRTFLMSTFGFTCVAFVTGALALWAPMYMFRSQKLMDDSVTMDIVSLKFGIVTCLAGFSGVSLGYLLSSKLRIKHNNADAIICAVGLLFATPFLFLALILSKNNAAATWIFIFIGETMLSLNWALVNDILLYTVIPTRRSCASALQILVSHMFGDAGSPYLIGVLFDALANAHPSQDDTILYLSLQYALFVTCFICILGSGFFFACSLFIQYDKKKTDEWIKNSQTSANNNSGVTLTALSANNSNLDIPDPMPLLPSDEITISERQENGNISKDAIYV